jgi:hypothetical protein
VTMSKRLEMPYKPKITLYMLLIARKVSMVVLLLSLLVQYSTG